MVQLQSILLPDDRICKEEKLYFHRYNQKKERVDFDGYFNLFFIEKRKKYTAIEELSLSLTLYGYKELIVVLNGKDIKSEPLISSEKKNYIIKLPYKEAEEGVFWFALIEDEKISKPYISGAYVTEKALREASIAISICTYKREPYIRRNLLSLKERILDNKELNVSEHVAVYVIDNAKTLKDIEDIQEIKKASGGRIHILENKNAGGAGGFTRGMIEALRANEAKEGTYTHVLLMDDDAIAEPDALVRIYGFLATVKDEWKSVTLGGTMLREDFPYMLFCSGEWLSKGEVIRRISNLDIRERKAAACKYLTKAANEHRLYSGWWCCCYSLDTVRADNLPVPLFIHYDDIEFGIRNKDKGCVFLNGVAVWHKGFELQYSRSNKYYDTRNGLMQIALHQKNGITRTALRYYLKLLTVASIRMRYKDAQLIYSGLKDFLKGPAWLYSQDPEGLNKRILDSTYKLRSLDELKEQLTAKELAGAKEQIKYRMKKLSLEEIIRPQPQKKKSKLRYLLTFNGWLLPADRDRLTVTLTTDSPYYTFRKRKVVCYEPSSGKAFVTEKSYRELLKLIIIYIKSLWMIAVRMKSATKDYRKNISSITNSKAWEEYLKN